MVSLPVDDWRAVRPATHVCTWTGGAPARPHITDDVVAVGITFISRGRGRRVRRRERRLPIRARARFLKDRLIFSQAMFDLLTGISVIAEDASANAASGAVRWSWRDGKTSRQR